MVLMLEETMVVEKAALMVARMASTLVALMVVL